MTLSGIEPATCRKIIYILLIIKYTKGVPHLKKDASLFSQVTYRVSQEEWTKFGRVFLMLKYTDITQNSYIQS